MSEPLFRCLVLIVGVSLKATLLAAIVGLTLRVSRVRNSSLKHAAWLGVLAALVALPVLSAFVPAIPVSDRWQLLEAYTSSSSHSNAKQADHRLAASAMAFQVNDAHGREHSASNAGYDDAAGAAPNVDMSAMQVAAQVTDQSQRHPVNESVPPLTNATTFVGANWLPIMATSWMVGFGLLFVRLIVSIGMTRRLMQYSSQLPVPDLPRAVSVLIRSNSRPVSLHESSLVYVPLTMGWSRPSILLPNTWRDWSEDKLEHVIAHEMSHIRRGDCWTALLAELAICVYWFYPLTWWLKQRLSSLAEECCDDAAIRAAGNRITYARHLLEIASVLCERPHRVNHAGLAMTRRLQVERRILSILDQQRPLSQQLNRLTAFLLLAASIPLMTVASALQLTSGRTVAAEDKDPIRDPITQAADNNVKGQTSSNKKATADSATPDKHVRIHGRITQPSGQPLEKAFVALIAFRVSPDEGHTEALAETVTDREGQYELDIPIQNPKLFEGPRLLVRADRFALGWHHVDLNQPETVFDAALAAEQPIRLKLIDIQGQPASGISIDGLTIVDRQSENSDQNYFHWPFDKQTITKAALPALTSDEAGLLTIPHLSADHGVHLQFAATEKTAPQSVQLNTGAPEERPERDGTYRGLVRNFKPGETGTVTLAPARFFEGVVKLGDSNEPAANARITIWSSEQQQFGSMITLESKTDANGRFRLNPNPGVRFGIHAHPPTGSPYLIKKLDDLKWESGDAVQKLQIRLASGMVARGKILDAITGKPLAKATVQYLPNQAKNPNLPPNTITGWQGIQYANQQGQFEISIPGGAGTLLFHAAPGTNYMLQERGQQEIDRGTSGGWRYYAHAYQTIDPDSNDNQAEMLANLTIKLQPGGTVNAKLIDENGKPIKDAIFTSRLNISSLSPFWRAFSESAKNGVAEIRGLEPGVKYPVYFLDVRRQLGAVAEISVDEPQPTVVLKPCASAKARFVDPNMKPVKKGLSFGLMMIVTPGLSRYSRDSARRTELRADEDFSSNFDQVRDLPGTDESGIEIFRLLIPGATYRISNPGQDEPDKEFIAESGKTHDLRDIVVNLN